MSDKPNTKPVAAAATLRAYYRDNPADFINDWGVKLDQNSIEVCVVERVCQLQRKLRKSTIASQIRSR